MPNTNTSRRPWFSNAAASWQMALKSTPSVPPNFTTIRGVFVFGMGLDRMQAWKLQALIFGEIEHEVHALHGGTGCAFH